MDGAQLMWVRFDTYCLSAPREDVFAVYTDVSLWAQWSPDITYAEIDGPYEPGAKGRLRFKGLPEASWTVVAVDTPEDGPVTFTSEVRYPMLGLRLQFDHRLDEMVACTDVMESVKFHGLGGALLGPILRRRWARGWPGAMGEMGRMAYERAQKHGRRPA